MNETLQADLSKRRKLQEEFKQAMSHTKEKDALQKQLVHSRSTMKRLNEEVKRVQGIYTGG